MIYLTYNDYPSGIYSSQVIDVCNFLNYKLDAKIRLVSLVSLRGYFKTKKKIRSEFSNAIVLPMFPGIQQWKYNIFTLFFLFLFIGKQSVIARGPFATSLALSLKNNKMVSKVCFDARGAYDAEFNEYDVASNANINKKIFSIEQNAVANADFRIAVSGKLVSFWKERFRYDQHKYAVIPCAISSRYFERNLDKKKIDAQRIFMGYSEKDVVFVYSGSLAGWQSLSLVDDFLCNQMSYNANARALLLIKTIPDSMNVIKIYPDRVEVKWIDEGLVVDILPCCDFGLLIREQSITNSVASPVKFAEYLAAGLPVLISENIGDYSDFVQKNNCGYVIDPVYKKNDFTRPALEEKDRIVNIAKDCFLKEKYLDKYADMYNNIV